MKKLLVIDDDEAVRKMLRFRLKDSYEIVETGSPEEALAIALKQRPDAILLDLMMPKYSGFEVCQTIASLSFTQDIPIIIVSGEASSSYKDFCESLGAKDYMQKPVDFDLLEKKLGKVIRERDGAPQKEPRVRLRVMLKLRASDAAGKISEVLTATETVSATGFACAYQAPVKEGGIVEVYHAKSAQQLVGKAKAVHIEWPGAPGQRVNFTFTGRPTDWVLR